MNWKEAEIKVVDWCCMAKARSKLMVGFTIRSCYSEDEFPRLGRAIENDHYAAFPLSAPLIPASFRGF